MLYAHPTESTVFVPTSLQLCLRSLYGRQKQISNIAGRLIEPEAHPLTPQSLTHNVELNASVHERFSVST